MLSKAHSTTEKYKVPNIKVTVKNTLVNSEAGDYYKSDVSIKLTVENTDPLEFESIEQLAAFVHGMKIEDPQLPLLPPEEE